MQRAKGAQQRAIEGMKLAQQLRNAESELEKVGRLHAAKSRRVNELQTETETLRMEKQAKVALAVEAEAEAEKLRAQVEAQAAQASALEAKVERLENALADRAEDISELQHERMRLVAHIDTLQLSAEAPVRSHDRRQDVWRPPLHPTSLLGSGLRSRQQLSSGGKRPSPAISTSLGEVGFVTPAPGGPRIGGGDTARSDASTVSDAEWPEELPMG